MTEVQFDEKDEPLRQDVSLLGALLGEVLKREGGHDLFGRVESARLLARRRRAGDASAERALKKELFGLDPQVACEVVRAFSTYFGLTNLAERIHRIRRRRDYLEDMAGAQPGSFLDVMRRLRDTGVPWDDVRGVIETLDVEPVFTAHPTEATRRTLLRQEQRMARLLTERLRADSLAPMERQALLGQLAENIVVLWLTEEHPSERPTVAEEVEHVLFYASEIIYRIIPPLIDELERATLDAYGDKARDALRAITRPWLTFASWVGGDMDGNPNVNAETIRATLRRHRDLILQRYRGDAQRLFELMSHSEERVRLRGDLTAQLERYRSELPHVVQGLPARYHAMPFRVFWACVDARIDATLRDANHRYESPEELLGDIELVDRSARDASGGEGVTGIRRFAQRVRTFGFHLAALDVRQDSGVLRRTVGEVLGQGDYAEQSAAERVARLERAWPSLRAWDDARLGELSEPARAQVAVFHAIREGRQRYGARAIGPYIISMARSADDALGVLVLAKVAGVSEGDNIPIDVAPLFETVDDLDAGDAVLGALLANPIYRAHVASRSHAQTVMLGYSDSSKESGLAASRWALQGAQERLVEVARKNDVDLTLFHGRGGTASRGGSKPRDAILAEPPGAVRGRLRVTEQGEIIHAKYGLRGIAVRTLELTAGAVLEATLASARQDGIGNEAWRQGASHLADVSRRLYRGLIFEHPSFEAYFRQATPIDVIERMRIGSRPASRAKGGGMQHLRAIPWVFAWTQSRHLLPGWYGVGGGLEAMVQMMGLEEARRMVRQWPFMANMLADTEMVLAKSDMAIAKHYAELCPEVGPAMYGIIREEFEKTRRYVCELREQDELLAREPVLARAIRLRNPYVDPMSLIQVDLLARWRASGREDLQLERSLVSTVLGVARGLQNTG